MAGKYEWELAPDEISEIRQRVILLAPQPSADRELLMIEFGAVEGQRRMMETMSKQITALLKSKGMKGGKE